MSQSPRSKTIMKQDYEGTLIDAEGKRFPCKLRKDEFISEARVLIEGWIEVVGCEVSGKKGTMLVDEEGLLKQLPVNREASKLAGRMIVGPAIVIVPRIRT